MERNFFDDDDEFESFLKEKADQYKLYPSDKVWNGIFNFFHTSRKWYTLTGTALLFTTLFFIGLHITPDHDTAMQPAGAVSSDNMDYLPVSGLTDTKELTNLIAAEANLSTAIEITARLHPNNDPLIFQVLAREGLMPASHKRASHKSTEINTAPAKVEPGANAGSGEGSVTEGAVSRTPSLKSSSLQGPISGEKNKGEKNSLTKVEEKINSVNWLHELAVNRLSLHPLKSHLNLQFYASPTISYRRLQHFNADLGTKSNNIYAQSGDPVNIDDIVDQQPAVGLELGSALLFNASKRIVFKAGLQFNYVRYSINAYQSYPEKTAITLSSVGHNAPVDTITAYSSIRNLGGRYPEALQNQYAQLSLPIGAEYKVLGDQRFQLNLGGTIQPTYLLYNNTYLLTSDYGNYTKDPGLVRRWNVNAALEAYISYSMGGLRWQLGPQFRYQLLSTYNDLYPIREYLMEYGVKIGISKTLK